ncbi:unnamed protein product [Brassica oleracea var. botrytis]
MVILKMKRMKVKLKKKKKKKKVEEGDLSVSLSILHDTAEDQGLGLLRIVSVNLRTLSAVAHAVGFWDYRSFINAAAEYQPLGLDTAGDKLQGMKEVAAFLGGYGVATGGPLAWGLCYNKEMSPDQFYCDDYYKLTYPCTPGVSYYHVSPPTHAVDPPLWQSKRLPWTY